MSDGIPRDVPQDVPGQWLSVSAAARRLGVTPRAVRERIKRGTLTARMGNRGREIFVPTDTVPREVLEASQDTVAAFRGRAAGVPALPPREELEHERERRETAERQVDELRAALAAADRDLAVARRELELSRERLVEHQERERERVTELRAALTAAEQALAEARRSWIARLVGQVRDALRR